MIFRPMISLFLKGNTCFIFKIMEPLLIEGILYTFYVQCDIKIKNYFWGSNEILYSSKSKKECFITWINSTWIWINNARDKMLYRCTYIKYRNKQNILMLFKTEIMAVLEKLVTKGARGLWILLDFFLIFLSVAYMVL